MPVKDVFPRNDRWDSVGLYCIKCLYIRNNKWPNEERNLACGFHNISLTVELGDNNRLNGSWFCKNYTNDGSANVEALKGFFTIRDQLDDKVLYKFTSPGADLFEVPFEKIPKISSDEEKSPEES